MFHSKFNCKSRGTAIIINKSIPFTTSDIISDPNGRYIIVTGKLYNTPVTLANIYAPNYDDEKCINSVLAILPNLHSHNLILAGDFNLVMDIVLDGSSSRQQSVSKSAKLIQNFFKSANLIEAWRYLNPTTKKYSFFLQPHNSYSRIDYFFLDSRLLSSVKYIDYEAIVLSDHAPLKLQLTFPNRYTSRTWRMDNCLLSNETHVEFIKYQIEFYMQMNKTPEVSKSILWEALKAYLRGQMISFSAHQTKTKKEKRQKLIEQISEIDHQYAKSPTAGLLTKKITLQTEFNLLASDETVKLINRSRHKYYEYGDKIGKYLAH